MNHKKRIRYAVAGLSIRGIYAYLFPILGKASSFGDNDFQEVAELAAIIDPDFERARQFCQTVDIECPIASPELFSGTLRQYQVDRVLVCGPDFTHHRYIIEALAAGCDVITEKPMVISTQEVVSVLKAEAESGRRILMAHNYRYMPVMQKVKSLLLEGRIGRVTNFEFTYNLDTFHGASYFFRWNRERAKSGGLNIHKCCHHFDLVNWLIDDKPQFVAAFGKLNYYGQFGANRPLDEKGNPLSTALEKERDPYFQRHFADNYRADQNDIGTGWDQYRIAYEYQYPKDQARYIYDAAIDIEDTYGVTAQYAQGAILTYSCNFSTPWEGFQIGINGTKGRIELSHRSDPDPTGRVNKRRDATEIVLFPLFGGKEVFAVPASQGGHDGADTFMQRDLFLEQSKESARLGLLATAQQGGIAVAMGEAVYLSLRDKRMVAIADLLG